MQKPNNSIEPASVSLPAQPQVSTAREVQPEKDEIPGFGLAPAAGNLLIAIEESLASLDAGMVQGAADTLREALAAQPQGEPTMQDLAAGAFYPQITNYGTPTTNAPRSITTPLFTAPQPSEDRALLTRALEALVYAPGSNQTRQKVIEDLRAKLEQGAKP